MTTASEAKSYSFIIPSYNDAAGLRRHFEYFRARTEQIELVIVDDASTDDTGDVVRLAELPPNVRITYIRQARNCGPAAARNRGIDAAAGAYVMFLDADDVLADCFFTFAEMSALKNGADVVVFKYHRATEMTDRYSYRMHDPDNAFFSKLNNSGFPNGTFRLDEIPSVLSIINFPWNKIYARDFLRASGIRFPDMRMNEDVLPHWHSFLRARRIGVLAWAPPLVTHFEAEGASRATNYVGADRLPIFGCLADLREEIARHPSARILLPEFERFTNDFFRWMTDVLCHKPDPESRDWRKRYDTEIARFNQKVAAA